MPEVEKVKTVFQKIPAVYDRMNTLMSMGMDIFWRSNLVRMMPRKGTIIDVGTGTGKLADFYGGGARIIGVDITREMLELNNNKGNTLLGSGTELPLKDGTADGVMSAFLLRNLPNTEYYFEEAFRILKNGGIMANLDAFPEHRPLLSQFFSIYFFRLMPKFANFVSKSDSYDYLARSVRNFKEPSSIVSEMEKAGFSEIKMRKFLSPSACLIYGKKII